MSAMRWFVLFAALTGLPGCGLRVPPIDDFSNRVSEQQFVQALLTHITCELRGAVDYVHQTFPREVLFIDGYGIQTTLTLTYDEKGGLAPGISWSPPSPASALFTLGAGLTLSGSATRIGTIDGYYLVSDLKKATCSEGALTHGAFMLQDDLKLGAWLVAAIIAEKRNVENFRDASLVSKDGSVLQHEVKFVIETDASATPSWKLTRATVNPGTDFLTLSRTRTNDLIITLGPAEPKVVAAHARDGRRVAVVGVEPGRRAADQHLSALIRAGLEGALRNATH
jgi:hypothetical protein